MGDGVEAGGLSAFVVVLLSTTAVQAADFTISSGVADTTAKSLTAGETGLIDAGGVLRVAAGTSISVALLGLADDKIYKQKRIRKLNGTENTRLVK